VNAGLSTRVGVLGGGQLGRMLALAGYPLGIRLKHLGSPHDTSASEVAEQINAEYGDRAALQRFAHGVSVITYEWENVPVEAVRFLSGIVPVYPSARVLEVAQDRLPEKQFFQELGIGTAPFAPVDDEESLRLAIEQIGIPAILKTRRLGYDGKGQMTIRDAGGANAALRELGGTNCILEGLVRFERELSVLAVRSVSGEVRVYPLVENEHAEGILRRSIAPAPNAGALQEQAASMATAVLRALDYVGVLAIELFQRGDDLLANEMAPRVHNSGHWTIEGAETSQFENHLRAILDLPLGSTAAVGHAVMLNLIGDIPPAGDVLHIDNAHLHLYGKTPRPGRKVGHITLRGDSPVEVLASAERLRAALWI
jgi:5-(carboxyamino)imidazole ribonucleotide synthase